MAKSKAKPPNRGKRWEYKHALSNGKRKSFYSDISYDDAVRQGNEYDLELQIAARTNEVAVKNITFKDYAVKWLASVKGTVKDSTYNLTFKNSIENHLVPHFGDRLLNGIKQLDIQNYFNDKSKNFAKETLSKHKLCLNQLFESAIDNDYCMKNPCRNLKIPDKKPSKEKQVYTEIQKDLVLKFAETHRFGLEIELLLKYGLSRSELLGIRWEDINYANKVLSICRGVADVQNADTRKMQVIAGDTKNKFRKREIPLEPETVNRLKNTPHDIIIGKNVHKNIEGKKVKTEYVIHNSKGGISSPRTWSRRHYDVFMEEMQAYYKEKKIDVPILNPHELRHTRATLWVNEDKNLFAIASVLGWADLKMLRKRYGHSDVESNRKLLNSKPLCRKFVVKHIKHT